MLVLLCSAKGAPGVTTTAMALVAAAGERAVMVECDPGGGDLKCWLPSVQAEGPGLVELVARLRSGEPDPDDLLRATTDEPVPGLHTVTGPTSGPIALNTLQAGGERLATALAASRRLVFADAGRWVNAPGTGSLVRAASAVVVVLRPTVDGVEHARHLVDPMRAVARNVWLLLIGDQPYSSAEVGDALAVDVWGALPVDALGVSALLCAGNATKRWKRSTLARGARRLLGVFGDLAPMAAVSSNGDKLVAGRKAAGS